jgi:hypothetical protein
MSQEKKVLTDSVRSEKVKISKDDEIVMEGCSALMAVDTARLACMQAVQSVGQGPIVLHTEVTKAREALKAAELALAGFYSHALGAWLVESQSTRVPS